MNSEQVFDQFVLHQTNLLLQKQQAESTILYRTAEKIDKWPRIRKIGMALSMLALGGLLAAIVPFFSLEISYQIKTLTNKITEMVTLKNAAANAPQIATDTTQVVEFNPLIDAEGQPIEPVNRDFGLVIPSIGVNATVIPGVNPASSEGYLSALKEGVAHSSTSFYPNENGTVYLFSHSTNYEWFVKDINAIFYLLKNVKENDLVVVLYLGNRYTYAIRETKVVGRREVAYLKPQAGHRSLILQTCWPPGTNSKRLLIFADLIEEKVYGDFEEEMFRSTPFGAINRLANINQ